MYTDASDGTIRAKTSLVSPLELNATTAACLSFFYHMYGSHMGTLRVYRRYNGTVNALSWEKSGEQGNMWKAAKIHLLPPTGHYGTKGRVVFEAERGIGFQGDMAVDDIRVTGGPCSLPGNYYFLYHFKLN